MKKFTFFIFLIVCGFVGKIFFWPGTGGTPVDIIVESSMTGHQVADALVEGGLLKSQLPFLLCMRLQNSGSKIHIGKYKLTKGRGAYWLLDDLIKGRTEKIHVVVPEGFASWQIAERMETSSVCPGSGLLQVIQGKKLEGFLFPATYDFEYGLTPDTVAQKMKEEFDRRWTPEFEARAKAWGWTKEKTVTFASILEREVRVREELPLVSAVYHNRLKKNMRLEADPTVQYALGFWKDRLSYDDYRKTKSPYNTYLNSGLPPGPICSPGMESIKAALWPADSAALFFLATGDGHHTFSNSYREHTNKVNARNRNNKKNMVERKR